MKVFISHAGADTWVAKQIAARCHAVKADTFLDETEIELGADFETDILAALKSSNELVVLFTPWALERPYVWLEIGAAWYKRIRIIAVLHGISAAEIQSDPRLPIAIKERNVLELNDIEKYVTQLGTRVKRSRSRKTKKK